MSQFDFCRQVDAAIFGNEDLSCAATYTPPAGSPQDLRVLFGADPLQFGDDLAPVAVDVPLLGFQLVDVVPAAGAVVVVDGSSFRLVKRADSKSRTLSWWIAEHA